MMYYWFTSLDIILIFGYQNLCLKVIEFHCESLMFQHIMVLWFIF